MKPVSLVFNGINSFSEEQSIDFSALTASGLFGIFGDTGSGKSTILDAINFALYGDVLRSEVKGDIVNFNSKCAEATFCFEITSEGKRRKYRVHRRLTAKGSHSAELYEVTDGKDSTVASGVISVGNRINDILGVTAEDFRTCIALPQGEFAEFLNAKSSDRNKIIVRLFGLSKYDIKKKLSDRSKAASNVFSEISGKLSGYADVTEANLKAAKKELKEKTAQKAETDKLLADASAAAEKLKALSDKKTDLDKAVSKLAALAVNADRMEALRRDLDILPACQTVADRRKKADAKAADEKNLAGNLAACRADIETNTKELDVLEKKFADADYDSQIETYSRLTASYASVAGQPKKLAELQKKLAKLTKDKQKEMDARATLITQLAAAEVQVETDRKALDGYTGDDINRLISTDLQDAVMKSGYEDFNAFLSDLGVKIQPYESTESELYGIVYADITAKSADIEERLARMEAAAAAAGTDGVSGTADSAGSAGSTAKHTLDELVASIKAAQDERKALTDKARASETLANSRSNALDRCSDRIAGLDRDIMDAQIQIRDTERDLALVFGERKDYDKCSAEADANLSAAKNDKKIEQDKIDRSKARLSALRSQETGLAATMQAARNEKEGYEAEAADALQASGKATEAECIELATRYAAYKDAKKVLAEYDSDVILYTSKKTELESIEGVKDFDSAALAAANSERDRLDSESKGLLVDIAGLNDKCDTYTTKLAEKAVIEKQYTEAKHECDLLDALSSVMRGSDFINFVTDEYLRDISNLASSTLLSLTNNRYYLRYEGSSFVIHDNYNMGNARGVNLLSGGETFLVSLSLALSLSQTIYARSQKSIEFFFLDEGFGTLDSELCDTVIVAMQKLVSSSFTIGIISHVEDLKQSIGSKILVKKATETHGSSITVMA